MGPLKQMENTFFFRAKDHKNGQNCKNNVIIRVFHKLFMPALSNQVVLTSYEVSVASMGHL